MIFSVYAMLRLVGLLGLYLLPTIIASINRNPNLRRIASLNASLGWTGIGYMVCLILALSRPPASSRELAREPMSSEVEDITPEGGRLQEELRTLSVAARYIAEKGELLGMLDAAERTARDGKRLLGQKFLPSEVAYTRFEEHRCLLLSGLHDRLRSSAQALAALSALLRNALSQSAVDADPTFQNTVRRFARQNDEIRKLLFDFSRFVADLSAINLHKGRPLRESSDLQERSEQIPRIAKRIGGSSGSDSDKMSC